MAKWDKYYATKAPRWLGPAVVIVVLGVLALGAGLLIWSDSPSSKPAPALNKKSTPTFYGYQFDVVDQIYPEAKRAGLPPLLVLALAHQEGGLKQPFPVGDVSLGGSCGPFQIYLAAHGGTCDYWSTNIVAGMREMESRWLSVYNQDGGYDAFAADEYGFIQRWAPQAQGSIAWSQQISRANIDEATRTVQGYLETLAYNQQQNGGGATSSEYTSAADYMAQLNAELKDAQTKVADVSNKLTLWEQQARSAGIRGVAK